MAAFPACAGAELNHTARPRCRSLWLAALALGPVWMQSGAATAHCRTTFAQGVDIISHQVVTGSCFSHNITGHYGNNCTFHDSGPHWGPPSEIQGQQTALLYRREAEEGSRGSRQTIAVDLQNANDPVPPDVDQVALFRSASNQQLALFGSHGCAVHVVVVTTLGVFRVTADRYFEDKDGSPGLGQW